MFNKIDDPSKQTVAVIYKVVFTTDELMNPRHLAHLQFWLQKQDKKKDIQPLW